MIEGHADGGLVRIATVGFQGFDNIGDEAILTGLEEALASAKARITTVFSGPNPDGIAAFPRARRLVAWHHLPNLAAFRALRKVDLLVVAGGGIFNDHWIAVIPRYCAWVLAARLSGAQVAWAGVGVGPIRRRWLRWLTRLAARASEVVLVRDADSALLLRTARVRVVPDPSLFNAPPPMVATTNELALVVRAPTSADAWRSGALLDALAMAALAAQRRRQPTVILSMAGSGDQVFADALLRHLAALGLGDVACEQLGPTPAAALERLAQTSGLITVRLHGLLLGALAGVPCVPIAYDDKVRVAAERLGLGDVVVPLAGVADANLLQRLDIAAAQERRTIVSERVQMMRAERDDVARALVRAGRRR